MRTLTVLVVGACAAAQAQDAVDPSDFQVPPSARVNVHREAALLEWRPQAGQVFGFRRVYSSDGSHVDALGKVHRSDPYRSSASWRFEVLDVSDGQASLTCSLRDRYARRGDTTEVDTRAGLRTGNPEFDVNLSFVGVPFTFHVALNGKVGRKTDLRGYLQRVAARARSAELRFVRGWHNCDNLQPCFPRLPSKRVKPGTRWAVARPFRRGSRRATGVQTYVYVGIQRHAGQKCAKLVTQFAVPEVKHQRVDSPPRALYVSLANGALLDCEDEVVRVRSVLGQTPNDHTCRTRIVPLAASELKKPEWNKRPR